MRLDRIAPALPALLLAACSAPVPDCSTLAVQRNLSSLVRDRVLRAEMEASSVDDATMRARIEMATSVIVEDTRQAGGDARKVLCRATIAIEGMGADLRSIARSETDVAYWVSIGEDGQFLVGLMYSDLEAIAASHTSATWAGRGRPSRR